MMAKAWACTSVGGCVASLVTTTMPYLQFLAVILSIVAAIRAFRKSK